MSMKIDAPERVCCARAAHEHHLARIRAQRWRKLGGEMYRRALEEVSRTEQQLQAAAGRLARAMSAQRTE